MRDMNGNKVLVAASTDDNCGIRIGSNMVIAGNGQIDICPHGKSLSGGDNFFPGETNRIKLGGSEHVSNTDETEEVIFAYKPEGSEGEIVPFAITESGETYVNGGKIGPKYEHCITLRPAGNTSNRIYFNIISSSNEDITYNELWNLLDYPDGYDQHPIPAMGPWNGGQVLRISASDEDNAYHMVYMANGEVSVEEIPYQLTDWTCSDYIRII